MDYYIFYFIKHYVLIHKLIGTASPGEFNQAATLSLRQDLFPLQAVQLDCFQLDIKHTLSLQEVQVQHELTR